MAQRPNLQRAMEMIREHGIPRGNIDGHPMRILLNLYNPMKSRMDELKVEDEHTNKII